MIALRIPLTCVAALALAGCQSAPPSPVASSTSASAPSVAATATRWQCGEILLEARFGDAGAELLLPGMRLQLPSERSASGARYADAAGNGFWNKGEDAILTLAGDEARTCSRSERISPWQQARERGVAWRATGNEPGWVAEVDAGAAPALRAELDYGARKLAVAAAEPLPGGGGFRGRTAAGEAVALRLAPQPCRDGMSGHPFPATAELTVDGETYRGCAAKLGD